MSISISDTAANCLNVAYIHNRISDLCKKTGAVYNVRTAADRTVLEIQTEDAFLLKAVRRLLCEVIAVGYQYSFYEKSLGTPCLTKEEREYLILYLIAADFAEDSRGILQKIGRFSEFGIDGFVCFRLKEMKEKWARVASYVPPDFDSDDLCEFIAYHLAEADSSVYLYQGGVYGENYKRRMLSPLIGAEDCVREIILSGCSRVVCMDAPDERTERFLKKYYRNRTKFRDKTIDNSTKKE